MLQRGQQLGLLPVAGQLPRIGKVLGVDLLDGHLAAQVAIAGAANRGKLALGDRIEDFVTVCVHFRQRIVGVGWDKLAQRAPAHQVSLSK